MMFFGSGKGAVAYPLVLALMLTATAAGLFVSNITNKNNILDPQIMGFLWPDPKPLTPFELTSTENKNFSLESLKGRWTLLFFGYTFCPDVCPTALTTLTSVLQRLRLEKADDDVQIVFVSVDPARDTIEQIQKYVGYFDQSFIGATAPLEQLETLTRQLGVLHERYAPDEFGNYVVDHTASVMLIDPSARLVGIFSAPLAADDLALRFRSMRGFLEKQK
jgi:protein SCO1/2